MDMRSRFCSTFAMHVRLHKALLAVVFALSFILNGSAMQMAHAHKSIPPAAMKLASDAMPCKDAGHTGKDHPCCPEQGQEKASCTAECCTSVLPVTLDTNTQFTFVKYLQRPEPALVLSSRFLSPPRRPPQV